MRVSGGAFFMTNTVPPEQQAAAWEFMKFMWETDSQVAWHLVGLLPADHPGRRRASRGGGLLGGRPRRPAPQGRLRPAAAGRPAAARPADRPLRRLHGRHQELARPPRAPRRLRRQRRDRPGRRGDPGRPSPLQRGQRLSIAEERSPSLGEPAEGTWGVRSPGGRRISHHQNPGKDRSIDPRGAVRRHRRRGSARQRGRGLGAPDGVQAREDLVGRRRGAAQPRGQRGAGRLPHRPADGRRPARGPGLRASPGRARAVRPGAGRRRPQRRERGVHPRAGGCPCPRGPGRHGRARARP